MTNLPIFDAATHTYTMPSNPLLQSCELECIVPSVTALLRDAGLIDTTWFTEYARERGTAVHAAVLYDDQGDLDESTLDEVVRPYLQQWRECKKMLRFQILDSERLIYSPSQGYAGTFDKIVKWTGRRLLIDIKTNHAPAWVKAQLGAYSFAAREMGMLVQDTACLVLRENTYKLQLFDRFEAEAEWFSALAKARGLANA